MKWIWHVLQTIGFGLMVFACIVFAFGAALGITPYRHMKSWTPAEATVAQSSIVAEARKASIGRGLGWTRYTARFLLQYQANGQVYMSQVDIGYYYPFVGAMAKWVDRLPPGSHRAIRFNPENPLQASLASGFDSLSFAPTLAFWRLALFLAALGAALYFPIARFGPPPA